MERASPTYMCACVYSTQFLPSGGLQATPRPDVCTPHENILVPSSKPCHRKVTPGSYFSPSTSSVWGTPLSVYLPSHKSKINNNNRNLNVNLRTYSVLDSVLGPSSFQLLKMFLAESFLRLLSDNERQKQHISRKKSLRVGAANNRAKVTKELLPISPARILEQNSWRGHGTSPSPHLPTLRICLESNPFKLNPPFGKVHPGPCGKSGWQFCCPLTSNAPEGVASSRLPGASPQGSPGNPRSL